ncbi:hypothetical protein H7I02_03875 [Mycolicibacterium brumae]|nr:hypothetical protein [Mycolicibacterium brumae]RWA20607.1 hypothetical protein MBRU_02810 [Mycolicibacterium brumae DSM 44177]
MATIALIGATTSMIALISAPGAVARQSCRGGDGNVVCETNGSVSIKSVPHIRAPQANVFWPGLGPGAFVGGPVGVIGW